MTRSSARTSAPRTRLHIWAHPDNGRPRGRTPDKERRPRSTRRQRRRHAADTSQQKAKPRPRDPMHGAPRPTQMQRTKPQQSAANDHTTNSRTAYVRHIVDTAPLPTPAQLERLAQLLPYPEAWNTDT